MIHYENLKLSLRLGLQLKKKNIETEKIHYLLEFSQSQWLK